MDVLTYKFSMLAVTAAAGYGLATIGMKIASAQWSVIAALLILTGFVAATQAEIQLMRRIDLGVLYLLIIAIETLIVLSYAFFIGEGLNMKEAAGGILILAGLAVASI